MIDLSLSSGLDEQLDRNHTKTYTQIVNRDLHLALYLNIPYVIRL